MDAPQIEEEEKVVCGSVLAQRIHDIATKKRTQQQKNELFSPGRMVFRFDLSDDPSSEIPTTVIRSKAEFAEYQVIIFSFNS